MSASTAENGFAQTVKEAQQLGASDVQIPSPVEHIAPAQEAESSPESLPEQDQDREGASDGNAQSLTLADVIASLYRSFPVVAQAQLERARASGELRSAYGAYDTHLNAYTISEPTGFYRNFRNGIGGARQTWWGGYISAGYRSGRGFFQPWYLERETNKGGEFAIAATWPLLQGRAIDPQRVAVFQASVSNRLASPTVQDAILRSSRDAAVMYWQWVAAGGVLQAQRELLDLAVTRGKQFRAGVNAGKFAEIDLVFNDQLIAERTGKRIESEQKFRSASFKLSLFLRDEVGQPLVPDESLLPEFFPEVQKFDGNDFAQDLADALARRPEPRMLRLEMRKLEYERQLASNRLLPNLDVIAEASQDVGFPTSTKNDKGQFELVVGLAGQVPIQRRKARGKIQETSAKIAQLNQKLRLAQDKIGIELQTAHNALSLSEQLIAQAERALRASIDTLARYRFGYQRGRGDLIQVNLLETKVNETEIKLVEAQQVWFSALADMQFALGLDPLDQAMSVAQLPPSGRPGPAHLPQANMVDPDAN